MSDGGRHARCRGNWAGLLTLLIGVVSTSPCAFAEPENPSSASGATPRERSVVESFARSALRYDNEYPEVGYGERPTRNAIVDLQRRLDSGEARLTFRAPRGYLDSLLEALRIDASSQTLVFSKTSLQISAIRPATPRAIYFNDDTYVAWVQGTELLEIVAMDAALGPVFYTLPNRDEGSIELHRETSRCLSCHDTFSMMGGGVPRFLFMSTLVGSDGVGLTNEPGTETTDATPLRERWGGWYVTGNQGGQVHLGNVVLKSAAELKELDSLRRGTVDRLDGFFDTRPYLTDRSDIVALLVFEHQAYIHNLITLASYKSRIVLASAGDRQGEAGPSGLGGWDSLSPKTQAALRAMLEPLVQAMLFVDATDVGSGIKSGSGFDAWFESQGPRDPQGRSLRQLDLKTRLLKYPMSYLVYSPAFDNLPEPAKEFVYSRLVDILTGRDESATFSHLSLSDRRAVMEILSTTHPQFARLAARAHSPPTSAD